MNRATQRRRFPSLLLLYLLIISILPDVTEPRLSAAQQQRAVERRKRAMMRRAKLEASSSSSSAMITTRGHDHAQRTIAWDPPELPPNWWVPLGGHLNNNKLSPSPMGRPAPLVCPANQPAVTMEGATGRTSNFLIAWATVLEYAVTRSPPRAVILSPAFHHFIGWRFDVEMATRSWVCVHSASELHRSGNNTSSNGSVLVVGGGGGDRQSYSYYSPSDVEVLSAPAAFRAAQNEAGAMFLVAAISQLLLRPAAPLRAAFSDFLRDHDLLATPEDARTHDGEGFAGRKASGDGRAGDHRDNEEDEGGDALPRPYVAIHLRSLEGTCARRFERGAGFKDVVKSYDAWASGGRRLGASDVCGMSVAYVEAVLRAEGVAWSAAEQQRQQQQQQQQQEQQQQQQQGSNNSNGDSDSDSDSHSDSHSDSDTAPLVVHRVVICSDGQDKKAFKSLKRHFAAVSMAAGSGSLRRRREQDQDQGEGGEAKRRALVAAGGSPLAKQRLLEVDSAAVDTLLMLRADFFIGNPASSFSRNVASIRRHRFHTESRSNLWGVPAKDYT